MGPSNKVRIVIATDNLLCRKGLLLILSGEESLEIVGEAANGLQAIDMIGELKPDVVLLDINFPKLDGIQIISIIKQKSPGTKVLLLSTSEDEATTIKALKAGAKGYLSRNTSISELTKAIKVVHKNELWVERKLISKFLEADTTDDLSGKDRQAITNDKFTPREKEVLNQLMNGHTNKEIAKSLFISEKTVKSHLNRIFTKLNVSGRLEAVLYAVKSGLL